MGETSAESLQRRAGKALYRQATEYGVVIAMPENKEALQSAPQVARVVDKFPNDVLVDQVHDLCRGKVNGFSNFPVSQRDTL